MSLPEHVSVAVIGAGFGGLGMGIRLRQEGDRDFVVLDRADSIGGTWRANTYPGAACDVPSHLYSYSFERWPDWTRRHATQPEILAYMHHCVQKYGLQAHLHLNAGVRAAAFDRATCRWNLTLEDGRTLTARVVVSATGQLSKPRVPAITGLSTFAGTHWHSSQWRHDVDLEGKRVGVVGVGASSVQIVPEVAKQARHLVVFQRSAPWVLPKQNTRYDAAKRARFRAQPWRTWWLRAATYVEMESRFLVLRRAQWLSFVVRHGAESLLRDAVADETLRQQLTPTEALGCKRVLISNDYYRTLNQSNVSLETRPITNCTDRGVQVQGGHHALDALVFATGFQATSFLSPMRVLGVDGQDLHTTWNGGAQAHLGISVPGFPNFFLLYGPNTNLGHSSIIYMLECQIRYVMGCLKHLRSRHIDAMQVRPEALRHFSDRVQRAMRSTAWTTGCSSWYMNADGKVINNWPFHTFTYRRWTRRPRMADFETLSVTRDASTP